MVTSHGIEYYLIDESGYLRELTLETLREAYFLEGVPGEGFDDYKNICVSMLTALNEHLRGQRPEQNSKVVVLFSEDDIPNHDDVKTEIPSHVKIEKPWIMSDQNTVTDYFNCYVYEEWRSFPPRPVPPYTKVSFCQLGFTNNKIVSFEMTDVQTPDTGNIGSYTIEHVFQQVTEVPYSGEVYED